MPLHHHEDADSPLHLNPVYASSIESHDVPKLHMPPGAMDPDVAYQIVHDELMLDGNARLNLATFVTTWMEPQANRLMAEASDKNVIDKDEYPQTAEIERRCVHMLADLWHATQHRSAVGCSTTGSSEAAMLAGLALKWRWRERRRAAGLPADRPNMVMGINVQVCWEKFCRYWDVEARYVPMEGERRHLTGDEAVKLCDEDTIGVVAVLGSTQDGSYEPVQEIAAALDRLRNSGGADVPVHVDAASGGFIAPFVQPHLEWDFRLPRVVSINTSGHKYGLVYPGVGWVIWREREALPEPLVFHVNYLGGSMPTFALNFSRPGAQVIAQYYNLLRLGFDGYRRVQQAALDTAQHLSSAIDRIGPFHLLTHGDELPVFAFTLKPDVKHYTVFDVSDGLRKRGWQVPAYHLPENLQSTAVLRVVVRNGFSRDLADVLLSDLRREVAQLERVTSPLPQHPDRARFHH
ncbi:MAG: glutamate decarboxylase [Candidatus Dormibacteraeota bacterium]|nr:glutamate decarboxylase [Candidatus Dormibacteraeota bacterium]